MRISLLASGTLYPLAGEEGVSERVHSSAGDFRIAAAIMRERKTRVRAARSSEADRRNLATTISFSSRRQFGSAYDAAVFVRSYDSEFPHSGTLVMQPVSPGVNACDRHMTGAVLACSMRLDGACVHLSYTARGGCVITDPAAVAGAVLDADGSAVLDADGSVLTDP